MQDRALLSAVERLHAQERGQSVFALTASVHKGNVCQTVIRIAVVQRKVLQESVEIHSASVGLTVSAHLVNVPHSAWRDAVLSNGDISRSDEMSKSVVNVTKRLWRTFCRFNFKSLYLLRIPTLSSYMLKFVAAYMVQ